MNSLDLLKKQKINCRFMPNDINLLWTFVSQAFKPKKHSLKLRKKNLFTGKKDLIAR